METLYPIKSKYEFTTLQQPKRSASLLVFTDLRIYGVVGFIGYGGRNIGVFNV